MILKASDSRRFLDLSRNFAVRCHNGNPLKFLRIKKTTVTVRCSQDLLSKNPPKPTKTYQNLNKFQQARLQFPLAIQAYVRFIPSQSVRSLTFGKLCVQLSQFFKHWRRQGRFWRLCHTCGSWLQQRFCNKKTEIYDIKWARQQLFECVYVQHSRAIERGICQRVTWQVVSDRLPSVQQDSLT